jgi:hypothetical protein
LKRGIYLVANRQSADECGNLVYSIRRCGCQLPIRIIPFGGEPLPISAAWNDVRVLSISDFPEEGVAFVEQLKRRIPNCSLGFLRRFLAWFGEFDEFLYSDNDVVALMNWEELFPYLEKYDLVHADLEFTTKGIFNMRQPDRFEELMGPGALEIALTAGHFLCRPRVQHRGDLLAGLAWMEAHPEVPVWHDQTLMHVTLALAKWPALNLCKPPYNWADPHAGSYLNILDLCRVIQTDGHPMSHLHYSGINADGAQPIDELLYTSLTAKQRNRRLLRALIWEATGLKAMRELLRRAVRKARRIAQRSN